jgi:threonine/homoserine/homoserine lactone efflux protein
MFGIVDYWAFVLAVIVFLAIPGVGNFAIITSTGKGRKDRRSNASVRRRMPRVGLSY